jgi:glycosyltransferase involved in cell wall biosynthesis
LAWSPQDYIGPRDANLVEAEKARLHQDGVTWKAALPNNEVLGLMSDATFLVLPTFHDTFGFVAIEALAGGTPVIATATCALPEIVEEGGCGFLLPFDNDPTVGKWTRIYESGCSDYEPAYRDTVDVLAQRLAERLPSWWEARNTYPQLSAKAIDRAATRFSYEGATARLEALYERARRTDDCESPLTRIPEATR